ncbi:MAG: ATP-binding protein [Methanomassiliicoccales archaeon]|uniref:ATP-binding protein n=1 Tax=Candidatus Methanarcanum hacksteinii TaxID=2911857 RepID=UPI002A7830CA|nr:ATP-binding protein [Candidatus Methanomethylophilaceae archaeon]MDD7478975.1 ATP-binding protein [Methanomassiliicoccales archaeon]
MEDSLVSRDRYFAEIEPYVGNGNAKVITGIRRCGKSTLLEIYRHRLTDANVVYINTELHEFSSLGDWEKLLSYIESEYRQGIDNVLIVDEIQNIEKWELIICDLIARKMFDIYLTGSNANLLSSEYSTHLGGRFNRIRMLPLSYEECKVFAERFLSKKDVLDRYMRVGGFPILWISDVPERSCMQTVRDITEVILSKDIEQRFNIRNHVLLRDIYCTILSTIGSYVSSNNIYSTIRSTGSKTTVDTVNEYIGHLEAANLIIRANVFDLKGRRTLENKHKYYATDLGLKHSLLGYRPEDISGHMENILFIELMYRGYEVYVGDYNGKEIDLVAIKDGSRLYIQACSSIDSQKTFDREFGNLAKIPDSFPKYVVMMEPGAYRGVTDTGIICCSLVEFLEKENY